MAACYLAIDAVRARRDDLGYARPGAVLDEQAEQMRAFPAAWQRSRELGQGAVARAPVGVVGRDVSPRVLAKRANWHESRRAAQQASNTRNDINVRVPLARQESVEVLVLGQPVAREPDLSRERCGVLDLDDVRR